MAGAAVMASNELSAGTFLAHLIENRGQSIHGAQGGEHAAFERLPMFAGEFGANHVLPGELRLLPAQPQHFKLFEQPVAAHVQAHGFLVVGVWWLMFGGWCLKHQAPNTKHEILITPTSADTSPEIGRASC